MKEIYRKALGMIDLTSLNPTDTPTSIKAMTVKVNEFKKHFPDCPLPASICVFPNFAKTVRSTLTAPGVNITVVGGCFPASQSFLEVKTAGVGRLIVGHFSSRYKNSDPLLAEARAIFPDTDAAMEGARFLVPLKKDFDKKDSE